MNLAQTIDYATRRVSYDVAQEPQRLPPRHAALPPSAPTVRVHHAAPPPPKPGPVPGAPQPLRGSMLTILNVCKTLKAPETMPELNARIPWIPRSQFKRFLCALVDRGVVTKHGKEKEYRYKAAPEQPE